jgi:hypothetical protein
MPEETIAAGGLPLVEAEPVPSERGLMTMIFRGEWTKGGSVERNCDFAVLRSRSGLTVHLDRRAVELAAMALGLRIAR